MVNKQKVIVEIEYGSDWQKDVHNTSLNLFLNAWKYSMELKHKKNKVKITTEHGK